MTTAELVGYIASVLIAISMTMSSIQRLRLLNLVGGTTMAGYAIAIEAWPVLVLNGLTIASNLWHLMRLWRRTTDYSLLRIPDSDYPYMQRFLDFYAADIHAHLPEFDRTVLQGGFGGFFVLRNLVSTGLFLYREQPVDKEIEILLDYVTPHYRDLRTSQFAYREREPDFAARGFRRFRAMSRVPKHQRYLRRVGFTAAPEQPDTFFRQIAPNATANAIGAMPEATP